MKMPEAQIQMRRSARRRYIRAIKEANAAARKRRQVRDRAWTPATRRSAAEDFPAMKWAGIAEEKAEACKCQAAERWFGATDHHRVRPFYGSEYDL